MNAAIPLPNDSRARRLAEAQRFLSILDETAETWCFQTFDDTGKRGDLARTIHGDLPELFDELDALNRESAGVFVTINEVKHGAARTAANIIRCRAAFADFDPPKTAGPPEIYPLPPVLEVESSPGRRHAYWPVDGLLLDQFTPLQRALAGALGSDPAPIDLPRVMRLPGFRNMKNPLAPAWVRIVNADERLPFKPEDLWRAFPRRSDDAAGPRPDLESDPIVKALADRGLLLREKPGGGWFLTCPWSDEHTTPSTPTSTVYYPAHTGGYAGPAFKCHHSHCTDRTAADLRRWLGGDAGPDDEGGGWPEPHPLTVRVRPEPYPADALPPAIRAAVAEVAGFVKAPLPLVASSALAALSVAAQGLVDVQRAEKLLGPSGLFLLTIADSGERKTTCDGFFSSAVRRFEEEEAQAVQPELDRHRADLDAWTAERDGILAAIKTAAGKGNDTAGLRARLARLQQEQPTPPRVPRLLLGDETPEALAWQLARGWPSAGVLSSEAGVIFGAHGMGRESVLRNLAFLNVMWDGGEHSVGRRTSERYVVRGARLTLGLQIQEAALRDFFVRSGGLARGTGFLARFLVAWPESTQGFRPFADPPARWPHLAGFHARLGEILRAPVPIGDDGALTPAVLTLSPAAKAAWVQFHDAIEAELCSGGELYDVRDVASKTADNAARLAALFHVYAGEPGPIGAGAFEGASRIAAWHLSEARRFFGDLALPEELADAARLDGWLIDHGRRQRTHLIAKNHARQYGPIRDGKRLDAALRELSDLDRLRVRKHGRRLTIQINPGLLG